MISKIVRHPILVLSTVLALAIGSWGQPTRPPAACSNATFSGTYGVTFDGIDSHSRLRVAVAQITAGGNGKFAGLESESKGGVINSNVPITGTYAIKADCTGSGTWLAQGGKLRHYNIVLVSGGAAAELMQTDAGHTESGFVEAQGKATCTNAGVKGTFGFRSKGSFVGGGPTAFIGQFKLDGAGNIVGNESGSVNGTIFTGVPLVGTYTVNSNCTGSATVNPKGQTAVNFNLVVVAGGLQVLAVETDANSIVNGSLQK